MVLLQQLIGALPFPTSVVRWVLCHRLSLDTLQSLAVTVMTLHFFDESEVLAEVVGLALGLLSKRVISLRMNFLMLSLLVRSKEYQYWVLANTCQYWVVLAQYFSQ